MDRPDYLPANYPRIEVVSGMDALREAAFGPVNCFVHPRTLTGDFRALAWRLDSILHVHELRIFKTLSLRELHRLHKTLPGEEKVAMEAIIADAEAAKARGWREPENYGGCLRIVGRGGNVGVGREYEFHSDGYNFDEEGRFIYGPLFRKGCEKGRLSCCYNKAVTEYIRNEHAVHIRKGVYIKEPGAPVYANRPGDMTRQVCGGLPNAEPFVHRVPPEDLEKSDTPPDQPPRLLLIMD